MTEPKKNKDGLVGGQLVSPKDHARVMMEKKKKEREALAKK